MYVGVVETEKPTFTSSTHYPVWITVVDKDRLSCCELITFPIKSKCWWRRRESNPRPQMLPSRIYMLSSRLEVSHRVCRGNRADLVLFCENLTY